MAHNRSVLKERRIHPGALTYFAVADCLGLALGTRALRGALRDPLRCQKQILLNGLGLGSLLRSCLHEGSWGSATWTRNSDPHPDNEPWTTTGPRISCNLER